MCPPSSRASLPGVGGRSGTPTVPPGLWWLVSCWCVRVLAGREGVERLRSPSGSRFRCPEVLSNTALGSSVGGTGVEYANHERAVCDLSAPSCQLRVGSIHGLITVAKAAVVGAASTGLMLKLLPASLGE